MKAVAQTSVRAFHALQDSGLAAGQRKTILGFVERHGGDWSIGEIAHSLGIQKSTISARLRELLDAGDLVERPKRKDRCSGITVRPIGLPPKQGELFH